MSDPHDFPPAAATNATDATVVDTGADIGQDAAVPTRRRALMLGAAGVAAVVTVRPAYAQTAASVMHCGIQVPEPARGGQYIALDGAVVPPGTPGAFPGYPRAFTGNEVKAALQGRSLPGTTYDQGQAYLNYIRRLRSGQAGFTCYASIQTMR